MVKKNTRHSSGLSTPTNPTRHRMASVNSETSCSSAVLPNTLSHGTFNKSHLQALLKEQPGKPGWNSSTSTYSKTKSTHGSRSSDIPHYKRHSLPISSSNHKKVTTKESQSKKNRIFSTSSTLSSKSSTFSAEEPSHHSHLDHVVKGGLVTVSHSRPPHQAKNSESILQRFEALVSCRNSSDKDLRESLRRLRRMVLLDGLPDDQAISGNYHGCSLRGRVWKILLGIYKMSALDYVTLIEKGPCEVYDKIRNDTFRTMATDKNFVSKVDENMLSRILNAFVWKFKDRPASRLMNLRYTYVQGMNVLAAPFLYVMPETDAFFSFSAFLQQSCPLYVQPALEGVHCGLKILFYSNTCTQKDWSLPSMLFLATVMTLSACTQPLSEVLKLWDFLLAYGIHLNILCVIAQLMMMRDDLLRSSSPMKLLRTFPDLDSKKVINITLSLIPQIPEDVYDMLVRHPFDPLIFEAVFDEY